MSKSLAPAPRSGYNRSQMADVTTYQSTEVKPARFSYVFILGTLVLIACFRLATPLLVALFAYLALTKLNFLKIGGKVVAVVLFLILVSGITYALGHFINHTVRALPEIADKAIPSVIGWAREYQVELPFTDYDSFKDLAFDTVKSQVNYLGNVARFARGATAQFVFVIVGCVVAISLFLNPQLELDREKYAVRNNLYSLCCDQIAQRFRTLYQSFATVIGAQITISAINTVFTSIFVLAVGLPYAVVVIGVTFLCGLIPVIGNLVSNTVIVGIGFTVSPKMAFCGAGLPGGHPQAGILPQQQDHRPAHPQSALADAAGPGAGRETDGPPRDDPGARGVALPQSGGLQHRGEASSLTPRLVRSSVNFITGEPTSR